MRVLVGKLEEYRKNEAAMKDAVVNAQKTCDKMVREAEAKCAKMLSEASTTANQNAQNTGVLIAAEHARVQEARKLAVTKIDEIQEQMRTCLQALERVKQANQPKTAPAAPAAPAAKPVEPAVNTADAVADEISQLPRRSPATPSTTPPPPSLQTCSSAATTTRTTSKQPFIFPMP